MTNLKSFLYWNISVLFFIKCSSAELQYIPPSREIEVMHDDDYTFGVKVDGSTNIVQCYYTSDTGINGSFTVNKWSKAMGFKEHILSSNIIQSNGEGKRGKNEVENYGLSGECRIVVRYADNEGPTRWILTPFNNQPNGGHVGNLSSITYKVNFYNKVSVLESEIAIYEQASFFNYLHLTAQTTLIKCTLNFNNTGVIELDLKSNSVISATPHMFKEDEEVLDRISSLGHGLCGLKYTNATQSLNRLDWYLTATDDKGKLYQGQFRTIIKSRANLYSKQEINLGNKFVIQCGDIYSTDFCYLYNPSGELVQTQRCKYEGDVFTMADVGIWKCDAGNKLSMETTQYIIGLINKFDTKVVTWVKETDHYMNIACQLTGSNYGISSCRMIAPNGKVLNLQPFSATDRYLSFGTNFENGICEMQIPKPLQEFENGMWQCEISEGGLVHGRFIAVNNTKEIDYPKDVTVEARLNKPFTVSCNVPYTSEFCYILAPKGTTYMNGTNFLPELGRCSITIPRLTEYHVGLWICSFAREIGVPDDEIRVKVSILDVIEYSPQIIGNVGANTRLMCHTNGLPLKYCRFTNPMGETFHIHNHDSSTRLSYYGKGIEFGDCGITIHNTQLDDFGSWKCITEMVGYANSGQLSRTIKIIYRG